MAHEWRPRAQLAGERATRRMAISVNGPTRARTVTLLRLGKSAGLILHRQRATGEQRRERRWRVSVSLTQTFERTYKSTYRLTGLLACVRAKVVAFGWLKESSDCVRRRPAWLVLEGR